VYHTSGNNVNDTFTHAVQIESAIAATTHTRIFVFMFVLQKRGFEYMHRVATSCEALASHLVRAAQFNVGRAYFQGAGVRRSISEAERLFMHFNIKHSTPRVGQLNKNNKQ